MSSPRTTIAATPRSIASRCATMLLVLGLLSAATVAPATMQAAEPLAGQARGTAQRIVHGKVEDKGGAGIEGAVVYLKDGRNASVKSVIADKEGTYRFVQLAQETDYEIWAQSNAVKSPVKSISRFDTKNDLTVTLKIDK